MAQTVENILGEAMALSSSERAEIASELIRSLDGPTPDAAEQARVDEAWMNEIRRRSRKIKDGTAVLIPGEQIMAKLRARAAGHRVSDSQP